MGGTNHAIQTALLRQPRQFLRLLRGRQGNPQPLQIRLIHTGQHRHRNQQRRIAAKRRQRVTRRCHHACATAGVHIDHPYPQLRGSGYGSGRGVGNIVKFEIEKHIKAALLQVFDQLRPKQREHLFADFQPTVFRVDAIDKVIGRTLIGVIQRNNNRRTGNRGIQRGV